MYQPSILASLLLLAIVAGWPAPAASEQLKPIDADAHYPEGPQWSEGKLFYVEYSANTIKTWSSSSGNRVLWHKEGCGPSGLITQGKQLLVACCDGNYLARVDRESGRELAELRLDRSGRPFTCPNDFAADEKGAIYFSASGIYDIAAPITGAVMRLEADGKTITRLASEVHYSNGLVVTRDGKQLLVAEMLAGRILSFPIGADGTLGARSVWARLQDLTPPTPGSDAYNGPDGLKLGSDGNYYIAQNGSGRVLVVNDRKKLVRTLKVPTPFVTNVAFGSTPDELFITGAFEQWKPPFPGVVYRWTARP